MSMLTYVFIKRALNNNIASVTLMLGQAQDGTGAVCLFMLTYVFIKRALNNNIASCDLDARVGSGWNWGFVSAHVNMCIY